MPLLLSTSTCACLWTASFDTSESTDCQQVHEILCAHCSQAGFACRLFLTSRYLAIAMEYVAGGDMFEYVVRKGGLKESEARWFFQQLIIGVDYLHRMVQCQSTHAKNN